MMADLPAEEPPAVERPAPVLRSLIANPRGASWVGELVTYASARLANADQARAEGHGATFWALMGAEAVLATLNDMGRPHAFLLTEWERQRAIPQTCKICGASDWGRVDCTEDGQ